MEVLGVKDEKNFYGYEISGELCTYNVDTKKTKVFKKAMGKNMYIQTADFSDKWIVWVEGSDKETTDATTGVGWALYAENIKTGEVTQIDKDIDKDINNLQSGFRCSPNQVTISGDNIVYSNFKRDSDKSIKSVIKLANLKNKTIHELDEIKDIDKYFYSDPSIYNDNIVWSVTKLTTDPAEHKKFSNITLYNLKDKNKTILSKNVPVYDPIINNNLIAADFTVNDITNIVLYDLNKKNEDWKNCVNSSLPIYQNTQNSTMAGPLFSKYYMIWWDNKTTSSQVIDTKSNKIYILDKDKHMQVRGLYNKLIFWKEFSPDGLDKTITKYAILK
ncbi:hypothetical protein [Hathewaya massiliensis]|uniref:hypothetical protein n=1 Tax=Hathewaya massiliensis TaxID=1964382 RepID=UPI00115A3D9D|nr:hypothetical protein [Hathewaya massiliensis]